MSGGVGPTVNDIRLPKEEAEAKTAQLHPPGGGKPKLKGGFFSFRQLNALAVMVVFAASGMVSLEDSAFVIFSLIYIYFISKVAFPSLTHSTEPPIFGQNKILGLYVLVGAIIGLFLPIAYIFQGIYEGDKEGIKAAAPHVFLLASQVFMEGLTFSGNFSLPVRAFVPVFYNARRILTIMEWLQSEFLKVEDEYGGSTTRLYIGRGLSIANAAFWSFNLFGFLLPVYLPRAFKRYYSGVKVKD